MTTDEEIRENYKTPGHPTAYSAVTNVSKFYGISKDKVRQILAGVDSYTRHFEFKKPKVYNPYFIRRKRQQIQCDLIDIRALAKYNNGVNYLLVFIDCFSRKVWMTVLKNKTGKDVATAFERWLSRPELQTSPPEQIFCDRGTELKNQYVHRVLRERDIPMIHPNSHIKAGIAERVNRTLQNLLYKYMTENETLNYITKLSELVSTYNNRSHRSLGKLSPNEAELEENKAKVFNKQEQHFNKARRSKAALGKKPFKIGDTVRIAKLPDRFKRGYQEQTTQEYFEVNDINSKMPIPMYILQSLDTREIIKGGFYANELTLVKPNSIYKVEKVLKKRKRNGQEQLYVKWLHFGSAHNSWINADDVTAHYD